MSRARHPKPYNEGPRRQVTIPWKRRVSAKLEANERAHLHPANPEQLREVIRAPKGAINKLLDLKRKTPQLTSTYADAINEVLGIAPPLIEADGDDEDLIRAVDLLRAMTSEERRAVILIAERRIRKE